MAAGGAPSVLRAGGISYVSVRPYIYVEDVDETLQAVTSNGGEIDMPPRPEGTLRVATFRDPEGNVLGVWTETAKTEAS
jgi:predicted enzyme related to lactoylglutathione lyase